MVEWDKVTDVYIMIYTTGTMYFLQWYSHVTNREKKSERTYGKLIKSAYF